MGSIHAVTSNAIILSRIQDLKNRGYEVTSYDWGSPSTSMIVQISRNGFVIDERMSNVDPKIYSRLPKSDPIGYAMNRILDAFEAKVV